MQVPQVIDQNTSKVGLSVKTPESLNFCPEIFDRTIPSSEEKSPGSLSGINSEISGKVIIAINKSIA